MFFRMFFFLEIMFGKYARSFHHFFSFCNFWQFFVLVDAHETACKTICSFFWHTVRFEATIS